MYSVTQSQLDISHDLSPPHGHDPHSTSNREATGDSNWFVDDPDGCSSLLHPCQVVRMIKLLSNLTL